MTSIHRDNCSIRRQIAAIDQLHERGMYFFDYGNAFLLTAKRAGEKHYHSFLCGSLVV